MRANPKYVSGTRRDEFELHRAMPGLIAKSGAEAVYVTGLPDGRGIALKISDGSSRARPTAMAGVLMRLGFDSRDTAQARQPSCPRTWRVEVRPCAETLSVLGQ